MHAAVPTLDEWIAHCFDHAVGHPEWYFEPDARVCEPPSATLLEYLTKLFRAPQAYLGNFSDGQVNQGLWYLASASCSNTMFCLVDAEVSESKRVDCIRAMRGLYEELFAIRCTDTTSNGKPHASKVSELNSVCYMWWDLIPIYGKPEDPARACLDNAILDVMQTALHSSSAACQESALHGLGHWALYYPKRVEALVKKYLAGPSAIETLRGYALAAAAGDVQ